MVGDRKLDLLRDQKVVAGRVSHRHASHVARVFQARSQHHYSPLREAIPNMPLVRKRRAVSELYVYSSRRTSLTDFVQPVADDASDHEPTPTQRRRASPDSEVEYGDGATQEDQQLQQMAKKLVRMALACEYARIPIRRTDISAKGHYTLCPCLN